MKLNVKVEISWNFITKSWWNLCYNFGGFAIIFAIILEAANDLKIEEFEENFSEVARRFQSTSKRTFLNCLI